MASFPNVRPFKEPSATTEGFRAFACSLVIAASRIAAALSELATLRGFAATGSTSRHPMGTPRAPQRSAVPVGASTFVIRGHARG